MNNNVPSTSLVSTSALAKKLDLPAKTIFELLQDKGWIERIDNHWKLTGKGQFEGGDYVNSKKYGEYIGWPESILEHHIFVELFNLPMRTRVIGKELNISAHRFNALLAEIGWQKGFHRGWILTELGRSLGGKEQEDEESGIPYTRWPRSILDNPHLAKPLLAIGSSPHKLPAATAAYKQTEQTPQTALDFNAQTSSSALRAMDGHILDNHEDLLLDNWFYLMNVTHAYQRELPEIELGTCDFYLPIAHVYIECWHAQDSGAALSKKLERLEYYKANQLAYFEMGAEDLGTLDTVLPKRLLQHGITVY